MEVLLGGDHEEYGGLALCSNYKDTTSIIYLPYVTYVRQIARRDMYVYHLICRASTFNIMTPSIACLKYV